MTNYEANGILDAVKAGFGNNFSDLQINMALLKTGDLDLFVDRKQQNRIYSGQELKVDEQAVGCLSHAIKYWAADRKA
jgi:hypothetical protein